MATKAFWFVFGFVVVSVMFAILDAPLLRHAQPIMAFGRALGPLSAILATLISVALGFKFREGRFFIAAAAALAAFGYWAWKFYVFTNG